MATYRFRQFEIRENMMGGIQRYVEEGLPPGHFLRAIIENNLKGAVCRADDENMANLPAFVAWFYNEAPAGCWGSPENYRAWLARPEFAVKARE